MLRKGYAKLNRKTLKNNRPPINKKFMKNITLVIDVLHITYNPLKDTVGQ